LGGVNSTAVTPALNQQDKMGDQLALAFEMAEKRVGGVWAEGAVQGQCAKIGENLFTVGAAKTTRGGKGKVPAG
jgi:hypothetical protein